ncbi:MAG: ferritin-like domain-containing protein [Parafilimonas sp.]
MNTQMNGNGRTENNNTNNVNGSGRNSSRMNEFFQNQLKDIYWAEKKLVTTLPKMHNAATKQELKNAFAAHLNQTKQHVETLEKVFKMLGEKPEALKCPAMDGIVTEGENIISETHSDTAQRDIGLVFAGQKAEHYEIATYGALISLAKKLDKNDIADMLHKTLVEEKEANKLLSEIAEKNISYKSVASREPVEA